MLFIYLSGGPSLVSSLVPKMTTSVMNNLWLQCQAVSEDFLDVAYIWTHNGLRITHNNLETNTHVVSIHTSAIFFKQIFLFV